MSAAIAAAGVAVSELLAVREGAPPPVVIDRRLSSLWCSTSLRPQGWQPPPAWDPVAGDYRAADGWIRLHTNAPAHRDAALGVLGVPADRDRVIKAVAGWRMAELEEEVIEAGGCAASMNTLDQWRAGDPGRAVASEPLIGVADTGRSDRPVDLAVDPTRPLAGVRVLDLTRVLAGPVATRLLAMLGADVLRIDPPIWDEPGLVPDVMLGKRSARLDLRENADRERFLILLADADVLVHGYRPGALDSLGLDARLRARTRPGLIEVYLDAYGWTGPWAGRRGFDSLVQMSTGIADAGMRLLHRDRPTPLPVQALDHAAGYLMAHAAIRALTRRTISGDGTAARLSLARTAELLIGLGAQDPGPALDPEHAGDLAPEVEHTVWGAARRLRAPLTIAEVDLVSATPAAPLGHGRPIWRKIR